MTTGRSGSFRCANPHTIHWGVGTLERHLDREVASRRAFVISTRSVASNASLIGRLASLLGERCVGQFAGITQHAPASTVAAATAAAREAQPEVLISLGGGSPIDATKVVAFALATGLDLNDPQAADTARAFHPRTEELLPHFAIPTTLSAAELSGLAGFTTEDEREKVGLRGESLIPACVFFDASLTVYTPLELWLSTGIRAVDHAVETLVASGNHPLSDVLAFDALSRLKKSLLTTHGDPSDLDARTESQLGAWFSFTLPGPAASGLSHILGKRIGSRHGIPHGVSSCLLLPHVMRYLEPRTPGAQARIAEALGATCAADAVYELIAALGLPQHLSAYCLGDADLEAAARPVANEEYPFADLVGIYRAAL